MLVEFSVKNFRSIYDLQTISFVATNLKSSKENEYVDVKNIVSEVETKLLRTVGIYGANASGKSNIIKALEYFCEVVSDLPSPESRLTKLAQPFLYQKDGENSECFFQIVLIIEQKKYRYGFTVQKGNITFAGNDMGGGIITREWLFGPKNKNQTKYFTRQNLQVDKANLPGSNNIAPLEYEHTLFLTHAASYSKDICASIRNTIKGYIAPKFSLRNDYYWFHSIRMIENETMKAVLIKFLSTFGLDYSNIYFERDEKYSGNIYPLENIYLTKYSKGGTITLNMQENESEGTKKLFDLAGLILLAFENRNSGLIILDEIDNNFHPSLLFKIIQLFNEPEINRSNAQLLFTSHDTNLMNPGLMRRDQFYFAEKQNNEATKLYSLADLKGIRNDADFAKQFLAGFYGAIPVTSDFINDNKITIDRTLGL